MRESANGARSELYAPFVFSSFEHTVAVSLACESEFETELVMTAGEKRLLDLKRGW